MATKKTKKKRDIVDAMLSEKYSKPKYDRLFRGPNELDAAIAREVYGEKVVEVSVLTGYRMNKSMKGSTPMLAKLAVVEKFGVVGHEAYTGEDFGPTWKYDAVDRYTSDPAQIFRLIQTMRSKGWDYMSDVSSVKGKGCVVVATFVKAGRKAVGKAINDNSVEFAVGVATARAALNAVRTET